MIKDKTSVERGFVISIISKAYSKVSSQSKYRLIYRRHVLAINDTDTPIKRYCYGFTSDLVPFDFATQLHKSHIPSA